MGAASFMPILSIIHGENITLAEAAVGDRLGDVIALAELPLEQPCAGRGTCGLCKVLVESGVAPPDEVERAHLSAGELALNNRLACRARIQADASVVLSPIVIYSDKIFRSSSRYKKTQEPLGLAVDLGSTTVAVFLTVLANGEVCAGGASLNQQTIYGADVISRLNAALTNPADRQRLQRLALASINQAFDSLRLSARIRDRIARVVVVGNAAMHHLLTGLPVESLARIPFEPRSTAAMRDPDGLFSGLFPPQVHVLLPPLIGGFVGSDALACLTYFGFDRAPGPMAAIDLGTNGEVLVTDGRSILTASTAAGPAFEGVNISCGTRAVEGAIVAARLTGGQLELQTIEQSPPVGLTGSGLLSLVQVLRTAGVIEPSGRMAVAPPVLSDRMERDKHGTRRIRLDPDGKLALTQWDIRELQKAKGAIRAAVEILMERLKLGPGDLTKLILTGSFGGQIDVEAALGLGLLPPVSRDVVESVSNGAGLGAALFLSEAGFARGEALARRAVQVDLDRETRFMERYASAMILTPALDPTV
jgi:uncharacterized 2Fe-2S/4Fe-4S cluster protein (DUF4445 family)